MELIGNIVSNARVHEFKSGAKVVNFTIAINRGYTNKQKEWKQETVYFDCSYWNRTAVAPHITTGKLVQVEGHITGANVWVNRKGEPQGNVSFRAASIQLHGSKGATTSAKPAEANQPAENTVDDLPF